MSFSEVCELGKAIPRRELIRLRQIGFLSDCQESILLLSRIRLKLWEVMFFLKVSKSLPFVEFGKCLERKA